MKKNWIKIQQILASKISPNNFDAWIKPLKYSKKNSKDLVLICPNNFFKKKIQSKYKDLIETTLKDIKLDAKLYLRVIEKIEHKTPIIKKAIKSRQIKIPEMNSYPDCGRTLKPSFTFDRFVVGGNNELAYSATLSLVSSKYLKQNAIFLHSATGMGKSHLSQAAGHHILLNSPNKRLLYITANDFTSEMIHSLRNNCIDDFKNKYRKNCDVLVLENVHSLSKKKATQNEIVSIIDYLFDAGKKIVFSSRYMPYEISQINDRLSSRFSSSLVSSINTPDFKTRRKILKQKEKEKKINLSENVRDYLADMLSSNVRDLESGFASVVLRSSLLGVPIDKDLAKMVVKEIKKKDKNISVEYIKEIVCKAYNITEKEICSKSKKKMIVRPRQIAMFLARKYTKSPLQSIGNSFNRRHATAMHAISTIENQLINKSGAYHQIIHIMDNIKKNNYSKVSK